MKKSKQIFNEVELEDFIKGFVTRMKELDYVEEYIGKVLAFVWYLLDVEI